MRRGKGAGTGPELALASAIRRRGRRPRLNVAELPGKPDLVFTRERVAVFVDGELWHGAQWRRRGLNSLADQFAGSKDPEYWNRKITGNIARDLRATRRLVESGWQVFRLWEADVDAVPERCADRVLEVLEGDGPASPFPGLARTSTIDFFSGIGLMRMGLERSGWNTLWANDHDPMKRRLFLHNLDGERVELDDRSVHDISANDTPDAAIAAACFPCTDLSLAGKGRGFEGRHSSAYLGFADILDNLGDRRPPFVILENVVGLLHSNAGRDFRVCAERFVQAGYAIDALTLDAKSFVPQSRPRMLILGVRDDIDIGPWVDATHAEPSEVRSQALVNAIRDNADLPWRTRPMPPLPRRTLTLTDILDDLGPDAADWWSTDRVARLRAQVSDRHLAMVESLAKEHDVVRATAFRRMRKGRSTAELRFDGVAGCLRTPKGGSAKQMLVEVEDGEWRVRLLTPSECARLMGSDGFRLDAEGVSRDDLLFGFGDAVCVPVVEWMVSNYINPLAAELLRGVVLR